MSESVPASKSVCLTTPPLLMGMNTNSIMLFGTIVAAAIGHVFDQEDVEYFDVSTVESDGRHGFFMQIPLVLYPSYANSEDETANPNNVERVLLNFHIDEDCINVRASLDCEHRISGLMHILATVMMPLVQKQNLILDTRPNLNSITTIPCLDYDFYDFVKADILPPSHEFLHNIWKKLQPDISPLPNTDEEVQQIAAQYPSRRMLDKTISSYRFQSLNIQNFTSYKIADYMPN